MLVLNAEQIRAMATTARMVEALRTAFAEGGITTVRTPTQLPGDSADRLFVSMLAMDRSGGPVIKLLTILPENRPKGLVTVQGAIVVFAKTGAPIAILDGTVITQLRTGAASALASQYLSREDSSNLLIVGTGSLAPTMAASHAAVRPIKRISVWGRRQVQAELTADAIRARVPRSMKVSVIDSIEEGAASADIIACSTSSPVPILHGRWLKPGTHVDLVGSFQPTKRESDDAVVLRSRIFVDTLHGALHEGGDVVDPISRGVISRERIVGELSDLAAGRIQGRQGTDQITLFKSVGTAIEDLAVARMLVEAAGVSLS
ncbi:MAG TPA: ornithine cyclodeaminase family protein [Steroidobacter sp.]|uniref:ornithine cyclodeaminase family protein n=1 Tax=Steroidobacter sp. TaxID=1978227 RepID=UPI002ED802B3